MLPSLLLRMSMKIDQLVEQQTEMMALLRSQSLSVHDDNIDPEIVKCSNVEEMKKLEDSLQIADNRKKMVILLICVNYSGNNWSYKEMRLTWHKGGGVYHGKWGNKMNRERREIKGGIREVEVGKGRAGPPSKGRGRDRREGEGERGCCDLCQTTF